MFFFVDLYLKSPTPTEIYPHTKENEFALDHATEFKLLYI